MLIIDMFVVQYQQGLMQPLVIILDNVVSHQQDMGK